MRRCVLTVAAAVGAAASSACAPERIPDSPIAQGDAGIAFHNELAGARGVGATLRRSSGASYGGGSSSSDGSARRLTRVSPDLRVGGKACDWLATTEPVRAAEPASGDAHAKAAATDEWFASNCVSAGDLR